MPVVKDRRRSLRVELEGPARILTDRDEFDGQCVDLGLDGLAIRSTRAARPGELVTLEALLDGQSLRMDAKLARRQRLGGDYILGFAFVDLELDVQRRIEHLVFERVAGSPQGEFMRAFVAHADRVPPPVSRDDGGERTVVVGTLPVPVISGYTEVIPLEPSSMGDRTVVATPPPRSEARPIDASTPAEDAAVPEAWPDDEPDTARFRLLESGPEDDAPAHEDDAWAMALDPDESFPRRTPMPSDVAPQSSSEHTVVVGPPVAPPPRITLVATDVEPPPPSERTVVVGPPVEPMPSERTVVASHPSEPPPSERTVVVGRPIEPPSEHTVVVGHASEHPLVERTAPLLPPSLAPPAGHVDGTAERTLPFLHDLLPEPRPGLGFGLGRPRELVEHTTVSAPRPLPALALLPSMRALLDAAALLRRPEPAPRRGPRVIVAIPHRTYRRAAAMPWNLP